MIPVVMSFSSATPRHDAGFARELRMLADAAEKVAREAGLGVRWVNAADPDSSAAALVAGTTGVIVLGGADVDPALYGQAPDGAWMDSADASADAFEAELMREAIDRGTPVLAICRGMQLLNVTLGGTLVQHLGDGMHRDANPEVDMVTHPVEVLPGTRVAAALGAGEHPVRSAHHQAVAELGEGLVVTATSSDGVIEAIERAGTPWVVGVQWHPEDPGSDPRQLRALLRDLAASTAPAAHAAHAAPSVAEPEVVLSAASEHP
ncbi:gamma-glutamyl-gamma-aminobutyrate hydrolase family protein [Microbacterium sp. C7(2022)]|uniref:gamma-glutamyl-gamma-aminobutyrate hydrolase family protein n=1 Tax=Microbacterium sp. C7(2022) TaxID=2992759 RepID=UPI00237AB9F0|nr:gamma-glutamyl-gamma-aminobutyrate hydrolase family protein [Microbacterium sp. C7(2022)]MDE0546357.1 gamma-glutamyl-gamma-aminobutyrate hydrolase family protein [Microbacterium sp. C7(2022)]